MASTSTGSRGCAKGVYFTITMSAINKTAGVYIYSDRARRLSRTPRAGTRTQTGKMGPFGWSSSRQRASVRREAAVRDAK